MCQLQVLAEVAHKVAHKECLEGGCHNKGLGKKRLCIKHGGGRRCRHPDCDKGAVGSTKLCIKHGGGYPCGGCGKRGAARWCRHHNPKIVAIKSILDNKLSVPIFVK
jgi:hypothetical protein